MLLMLFPTFAENTTMARSLILGFALSCLFPVWMQGQQAEVPGKTPNMEHLMIRMAELEIHPQYLEAYLEILKEESAASMRVEPGVISIFPMFQAEAPTQIRLVEIYADQAAYEAHLKTPHFLKYKTSTLHMVKELRLVDMEAIDPESIPLVFRKFPE